MPKAVAVPYVIALILGIIVVAVIGYWFFVVAGGGGGQLSQTQCEADFVSWCTQYSATNYQGAGPSGGFYTAYSSCQSYTTDTIIGGAGQTQCQAILHQSNGLATGSSCNLGAQCASGVCTSGKCA